MVEQQFRIAEIEVAKSPTDEKIIGIFRYEGNGQKKKGTSVLILAEIASTLYAYERLLDVINATTEQTRYMIAAVEADPVARFEKLIQRINDAVSTYLEGEPTPLSWNRVNIFIMELSQGHICLTGRGRLMNLFLQKQEDGSYKTFDLFGSLEQPAEVDPQKPFGSLICGDMNTGDLLMAGTVNLERLRNEMRLKDRLTSLPPVSAALEIKQDLEARGIPDDFVAAVVACCELEMPTASEKVAVVEQGDKSTASIQKLRETEQETTDALSPTLVTPTPSRSPAPVVKKVLSGFVGLANSAKSRFEKTRPRDVAIMASLRGMSAGHGSVFTQKHKRSAIAAGAILVLLVGGFLFWKRSERVALAETAWSATYEQARDLRDRAESDLVYGNDARAKKNIESAEGLVASLDVEKKDNKERAEGLSKEIEQLRERLRKNQTVEPIELTALAGAPDGTLSAPVLAGENAYAVDNAEHAILKVGVTSKTVKKIPLPAGAESIVSGSLGTQSAIFATGKGKLYAVDLKTDAVTTLNSQPRASSTTDVVLYAGRAYSLDGQKGQVWRASSVSGGFGSGQEYIKASNVPLEGSVSMAIDSNVYILKSDGTVARFLSGGQEGFSLIAIDPPLRSASGIWTHVDGGRIAITDPGGKRIVIFNKDGSLKAQLISKDLTGPRDLDGDEASKRLLVIDGTRLLIVPLP